MTNFYTMSLPIPCIKRIARDVCDINKNGLSDNGIYYIHDEDDIQNGYGLIIGPSGTIYENGYYYFRLAFPNNYPQSPPKVTFCTYDNYNNTRFHPNLYRNGKTCLSILNTWKGDGWTSCQTIRSVLLTLSSILTNNPLTEEPGITIKHRDNIPYNEIIQFKNYQIALLGSVTSALRNDVDEFHMFKYVVKETFDKNKHIIHKKLKELSKNNNKHSQCAIIYGMNCIIDYVSVLNDFEKLI